MVSYGGKTIPRLRTAAILKIDILPYLSEKSSNFDEILYTTADFELDERHVIKNKNSCVGQTSSSTERISCLIPFFCFYLSVYFFNSLCVSTTTVTTTTTTTSTIIIIVIIIITFVINQLRGSIKFQAPASVIFYSRMA